MEHINPISREPIEYILIRQAKIVDLFGLGFILSDAYIPNDKALLIGTGICFGAGAIAKNTQIVDGAYRLDSRE